MKKSNEKYLWLIGYTNLINPYDISSKKLRKTCLLRAEKPRLCKPQKLVLNNALQMPVLSGSLVYTFRSQKICFPLHRYYQIFVADTTKKRLFSSCEPQKFVK